MGSGGVAALNGLAETSSEIDLTDYDSWVTQFPTLTGARSDDFDGDAISNEDEFYALTDPTDPSSRLELFLVNLDTLTQTTILRVEPFLNDSALRIYTLMSQDEDVEVSGFSPTGITPTTCLLYTSPSPRD